MELSVFRDPPDYNVTVLVPPRSTFDTVISLLKKSLDDPRVCFFEYLDDDDDTIIVRNDVDLESVFICYSGLLEDSKRQGCPPLPLQVCPRTSETAAPPSETPWLSSPTSIEEPLHDFVASPDISGSTGTSASLVPAGPQELLDLPQASCVQPTDIQFLGEMGQGSHSRVYRAIHVASQTVIAVKTIDLDLTEEVQRQILGELDILTRCDSPFIIRFYGAFFQDSAIHICTEFMDGHSLDRWTGQLPPAILGRIGTHVINGLVYLWQLRVMHRDVKPSNMLLNTRGECKLCDFGVSIQLVESIAKTYTGTCAYMAPERLQGATYRYASDCWSLGVSLYELCTGHLPFIAPGENRNLQLAPTVLMDRIVDDGVSRHLPPGNCPLLDALVCACMRPRPEERPTAGQLLSHPFYRNYHDHSNVPIAQWVVNVMQDCASTSHHRVQFESRY